MHCGARRSNRVFLPTSPISCSCSKHIKWIRMVFVYDVTTLLVCNLELFGACQRRANVVILGRVLWHVLLVQPYKIHATNRTFIFKRIVDWLNWNVEGEKASSVVYPRRDKHCVPGAFVLKPTASYLVVALTLCRVWWDWKWDAAGACSLADFFRARDCGHLEETEPLSLTVHM